jgi:predicted nucleic acid-binding protein
MAFVLDASVTISWAMRDEEYAVAQAASSCLEREEAFVPAIWWYEVRNMLVVNTRRKRIELTDSVQFLRELEQLPIRVEGIPHPSDLPELARRHELTVYDAAYLELAIRRQLPLATLDKALRKAAQDAGVSLLEQIGK